MDENNESKGIISELIPGLLICIFVMFLGIYGAELIGYLMIKAGFLSEGSGTPVSGIFVAIIIGVLIRNTSLKPCFSKGYWLFSKVCLACRYCIIRFTSQSNGGIKTGSDGDSSNRSLHFCRFIYDVNFW